MFDRTSRSDDKLPKSRASSASKPRRPSLPRVRSSQRLIHTISIEKDNATNADTSANDTSLSDDLESLTLGSGFHETIEVPYVKATLDASLPQDYFKTDVLNLIQNLRISKWYTKGSATTSLKPQELKLTKITGALTNTIFKVEYMGLPSLLLRIYGPNVDSIIDREYELQILARLSLHHIGPSLYGCFINGRFEQFLENSQTLTKTDIRNWKTSQRIARRMKELHIGVPLHRSEIVKGPSSWERIDKWMAKFEESQWVKNDTKIQQTLLASDWTQFKEAVNLYRKWLDSNGPADDLVFCHNDAQYGNLLFTSPVISTASVASTQSTASSTESSLFPTSSNISLDEIIHPSVQEQSQDSKLVVIDFEYSGPNPAAYDLANHLSEWMYDYHCAESYKTFEDKFPTREEMLNFVYSYVSHNRTSNKNIDDEVRGLYNSIIRWRALVQLFWSLWGIIQSGELDVEEPREIVREGPGGEKYVITVEDDASVSSDEILEGVDIDSFENLRYASEKIAVFWGDLIQLGIVKREALASSAQAKNLDIKMF